MESSPVGMAGLFFCQLAPIAAWQPPEEDVVTGIDTGTVSFAQTRKVVFGHRVRDVIAAEAAGLAAARAVLVASQSLAGSTDEIAAIESALGALHAGTVSGVQPHAPRGDVLRIVDAARAAGADLLVSVGGGSVTDATKVAALALANDVREVADFDRIRVRVDAEGRAQAPVVQAPEVRIIAVPTTLSGGEFNPRAGATDEAHHHKQGYHHPAMAPAVVLLDPELSVHTPAWVWLSTGVRAVDHAAELLASLQSNDFADGLAVSALQLLRDGLVRAHADAMDVAARLKCQIGVWQAMLAIVGGVPMGASHAIGHVLGGSCGVPHGYTSCVMLPAVMQWNRDWNAARQQRVAAILGATDGDAAAALDRFIRGLGLPRRLAEVGVLPDRFATVAGFAMHDLWLRSNPRPVRTVEDVLEILRLAA